ncbi:hypothetical protein Adu01nite_60360 [Paractinoplanes durhamensis]|uniref:Uncharacterized protein n=2 Tax=Paractinoplanes durhamensis TaxID=113563 RepID=A0ABQ3Z4G3_9ACTN|nr:hypothetical protein Adu01nite_60360 [Actinoplanes durhamensis]
MGGVQSSAVVPGRAAITAVWGFLAAAFGADLFADVGDRPETVFRFVVAMLGLFLVFRELTAQAERRADYETAERWSLSDTQNLVALLVLAAVLAVTVAFPIGSITEPTASACYAILYTVLAAYFVFTRRRTLRGK